MRTRALVIMALLAWLTASPLLSAQSLPGAGSLSASTGADGHAWVCVPVKSEAGAVGIVHLPPRGPGIPDGSVRLVTQLPEPPERLAARENRLYMAFRPDVGPSGAQRRVLLLTIEPGPIEGSWAVASEGHRLPALPSLPGEGELLGFAATSVGPAALLSTADERQPRLLIMAGPDWRMAPVPTDVPAGNGSVLVAAIDGLAIVDAAHGHSWIGKPRTNRSGVTIDWEPRTMSMTVDGLTPAPLPTSSIAVLPSGYLYWWFRDTGGIELWNATASGAHRLRALSNVGHRPSVAPMANGARVAVVWAEFQPTASPPGGMPGPAIRSAETAHTHVVEVSSYTGEVLYDGPAHVDGPVSSQELKLLAAVLVVVMAVVVLFVLRPGGDGQPISLPRDVVLSEPGRRVAAGLIDLVIAAIIAGRLADLALPELVSPERLLTDSSPMTGLIVLAVVGFLHGTLGEWLWGRTLGKAAVGCAVAWPGVINYNNHIEPIIRRPTLWRAATRNLIKWVLPPVAISGVFSPERRHRGDVLAGTAVVEHAGDDEDEAGDDSPIE
jgi:uncharacterized RDD family membrane protein YckC